jgi:hypothetical protein
MAVYLRKFETQSAYEAAQSGLILPNVSLTVDNNTVHYNPSSPVPPTPSHEYVDLGLPSGTKWATMNVGASSIIDYGNYYMYGKGSTIYNYSDDPYYGEENPLATSADTAAQVWGGSWHMPTLTQFEELTANTTYEWTTINGVNGGKFTAQNGNYVFFPAAGGWVDGSQSFVGIDGYYWSSSPDGDGDADQLYLNSEECTITAYGYRNNGCSVRGVLDT